MAYTVEYSSAAYDAAYDLCRGSYQRSIVRGTEAMSGATLKGKAKRFGGKYAASRDSLLSRLSDAGVPTGEIRAKHNKRVLVLGIGCPTLEEAKYAGLA